MSRSFIASLAKKYKIKGLYEPRNFDIENIDEDLSEWLCHNCASSSYDSTHRSFCNANKTKKLYVRKKKKNKCVKGKRKTKGKKGK